MQCIGADGSGCGCCGKGCGKEGDECKPSRSTTCSYSYSSPTGANPFANGISSGYQTSSDVSPSEPNKYTANKDRKYIQFDWKPVPDWGCDKTYVQAIEFKKQDSYGTFWLPGDATYTPNRFRIDFQKLNCGTYSWDIVTACVVSADQRHCNNIAAGNPPTKTSALQYFEKQCCGQSPALSIVSPGNGEMFPPTTNAVALKWHVDPKCAYPNAAQYNKAVVLGSPSNTEFSMPLPLNLGYYTASYSPSQGTGLNRCTDTTSTTLNTHRWYAEAATLDNKVDPYVGRAPSAANTYSTFSIVPNFVEVTEMVQNLCNEAGEVPVTITLNDQNRMNDKYRFEFSSTTQQTVSKTLYQDPDCNTASDGVTVTCTVSPTLGIGTYTLKVYTINDCDQTERLLDKIGDPAQYSIGVNEDIVGAVELVPSTQLNSDFTLSLGVPNSSPADYYFDYSDDSSCGDDCSGCSNFSSISTLPPAVEGTTVRDTYSCPDLTGGCVTDSFTFDNPGSYCFGFRSTATANGCSKITLRQAQVYVVKVHLSRDVDDVYSCKKNTPLDEGVGLSGEEVTLDVLPNDPANGDFTRSTGDDGVARFTVDFATYGNGSISAYTNCGGDPNDPKSGCISDDVCRDVYLDCAGLGPDGPFEEVLTYGFLGLPTTLPITSPTEYNVYMRVGTIPTPKEWMTSAHGDVYAPGVSLNWCNETSQDGTYFDGSLLERPEGNPYRKFSIASPKGKPYTGGFVFSQANIVGKDVERLGASDTHYYLSEPDTVGRYAFNLAKDGNNNDIQDSFKDARFDLLMTEPLRVPSTVDSLPSNLMLNSGDVFESDDLSDMITNGGYELNSGKIAVLYYTGSDDIEFNNSDGFRNLSNTDGRLVIITNSDVTIDPTIGYECKWDSLMGTGSCGKYSPVLVDYQPSDAQFRSNIEATILTTGVITITPNSVSKPMKMEDDVTDMKVLKIGGSLIARGDTSGSPGVEFGRVLGLLSARYPGEFVSYDSNMLYRLTKLDRDAIRPVTGFTQSSVEIQYGY